MSIASCVVCDEYSILCSPLRVQWQVQKSCFLRHEYRNFVWSVTSLEIIVLSVAGIKILVLSVASIEILCCPWQV